MTTLTASQMLTSYAELGQRDSRRFGDLRSLFGRMADAARAATARRAMSDLSEHMLRDLGLTRGDLDAL